MDYGRRVTAFLLIVALAAAPLRGVAAAGAHMHGGHYMAPLRVGVSATALPSSNHCSHDSVLATLEPTPVHPEAMGDMGAGEPLAAMDSSCRCHDHCHCGGNARLAPALPSTYSVASVPNVGDQFQRFSPSHGTFVLLKTRPPTVTV